METTQQSPEPEVKKVAPETSAPNRPKKKSTWGGTFLDLSLVLITAGLIGGSAYYLHQHLKDYHIPTALELAMEENAKLIKLQLSLEQEAFRADTETRLKQRFDELQTQLGQIDSAVKDKGSALDSARGKILALQHEIRQEDKNARSFARNQLIPGMMVGVIRTKRGHVYNGAIIRGIENKKITVRHDSGQARFDLNLLELDSLPTIVRYAIGVDNLIDTSDFQSTSSLNPKSTVPAKAAQETPKAEKIEKTVRAKPKVVSQSYASYDPKPGVPVLDSKQRTSSSSSNNSTGMPNNTAVWDAPDAPLPL